MAKLLKTYEVTVTARRVVDVEAKLTVRAVNEKVARSEVGLRLAKDEVPDSAFGEVDKACLTGTEVECVKRID